MQLLLRIFKHRELSASVVAAQHQQRNGFVRYVHERMQLAAAQHGQVPGTQRSDLKAALALGKLAPIPNHHQATPGQHEKNFLVVPVAVQANAAIGL